MATGVLDPFFRTQPGLPALVERAAVAEDLGHRPALDGLRGLAMVMVLLTHTSPPVVTGGIIALDIFFVMSAFLITTLLIEEHRRAGRIDLRVFYLRRALRLLPALLTLLAGVWAITLVGGRWADIPRLSRDTATILGYCHNWRLAWTPSWRKFTFQLCPCWSLAVEEQFYLTWPIVLAALLAFRVRRGWLVALLLTGIVVPPVLRASLWTGVESFERLYFSTYARVDGIALGCLLALARCWWPVRLGLGGTRVLHAAAWVSCAVLLGFLFNCSMWDGWMYHGGWEVVNVCAAVLILALLRPPPVLGAVFGAWPLRWLGRVSYGCYLWNQFVFCLVMYETPFLVTPMPGPTLHTPEWLRPPLIWAGTVLLGAASWYVVERPFLRLKGAFAGAATAGKAEGVAPAAL